MTFQQAVEGGEGAARQFELQRRVVMQQMNVGETQARRILDVLAGARPGAAGPDAAQQLRDAMTQGNEITQSTTTAIDKLHVMLESNFNTLLLQFARGGGRELTERVGEAQRRMRPEFRKGRQEILAGQVGAGIGRMGRAAAGEMVGAFPESIQRMVQKFIDDPQAAAPQLERLIGALPPKIREGETAEAREARMQEWRQQRGRMDPVTRQIQESIGAAMRRVVPQQQIRQMTERITQGRGEEEAGAIRRQLGGLFGLPQRQQQQAREQIERTERGQRQQQRARQEVERADRERQRPTAAAPEAEPGREARPGRMEHVVNLKASLSGPIEWNRDDIVRLITAMEATKTGTKFAFEDISDRTKINHDFETIA
jgi:hypothetical protein